MNVLMVVWLTACSMSEDETASSLSSASPVDQCIQTYSTTAGYGHDAEDLAAIEAECFADGGTSCDADELMTIDAAYCLAEHYELDPGLSGYIANLVYHSGNKFPQWNIDNLLYDKPSGMGMGGDWLSIHATDGTLLEFGSWEAMY